MKSRKQRLVNIQLGIIRQSSLKNLSQRQVIIKKTKILIKLVNHLKQNDLVIHKQWHLKILIAQKTKTFHITRYRERKKHYKQN